MIRVGQGDAGAGGEGFTHTDVMEVREVQSVREPARDVPVVEECDICIIGGSCTGVFAAVAAARLGARVAVVENNGCFGGVATAGLVNIWHSLYDTAGERQIIAGLTQEVIARLQRRDAVAFVVPERGATGPFALNTEELKIELDELVREAGVRAFLHARFCAPVMEGKRVVAAIIEDKSGRRAIAASQFIDASGDGDLAARAGRAVRRLEDLQPPTACAVIAGLEALAQRHPGLALEELMAADGAAHALPPGYIWSSAVPGVRDLTMVAGTRVSGADCSDGDQLTAAEMEGRRQVRAICDILRGRYGDAAVGLANLPAYIGVRETRHIEGLHTLTGAEVLNGERFADAVANGSYRVDIHHSAQPGVTFRDLNGREWYAAPGQPTVESRWREETAESPTFWQIPYRSLVPQAGENLLVAGRVIDADREAYGAVRVMVSCNQTGEAAGIAAVLALRGGVAVDAVAPSELRSALARHGAIVV